MKKTLLVSLALAGLTGFSVARAMVITEHFTCDPSQDGWQIFGNTNLFTWDSTSHDLAVTWDSTQPNSFFYHPLNGYLTRNDDFRIEFDLRLTDIASGVEPGKTGPMQLGFGFLNSTIATNASFMRGAFGSAPNVAEFDYYTDGYYFFGDAYYPAPATTTPSFISGVNSYDYAPVDLSVYENGLPVNQTVHVMFAYTACNQTAVVVLATNGVPLGQPLNLVLNCTNGFAGSDDFQADMFSISSYSSIGDDYDSVLAHGSVGNLAVTLPPPAQNLAGGFSNGVWRVQFTDRTNWLYTLERSTDFVSWAGASVTTCGNGTSLILQDTNAPVDEAFYRVRADRP